MTDDHGIADELVEAGQHGFDRGCRGDHSLGYAGEIGNERRNRRTGVDQGLKCGESFSAPIAHRADFGDGVSISGRTSSRFEIEDAKGNFGKRRPEIVEGELAQLAVALGAGNSRHSISLDEQEFEDAVLASVVRTDGSRYDLSA